MALVCLVIIDGYGISETTEGNATVASHFIQKLKKSNDCLEIFAHGEYVGLPAGNMGNSEVGHLTIGLGKTVEQSLLMINRAFESGELGRSLKNLKLSNGKIHLIGMISDGGIHSHRDHLQFILECLPSKEDIFVHAISDGIDVPPGTFLSYTKPFNNIVSISGRYFAMDRDKNHERTDKVFKTLTTPKYGLTNEEDMAGLISNSEGDEFIEPILLRNEPILADSTVIFFNFRADRMRQLYNRMKNFCKVYTITEYEDGDPNAILKKPRVGTTLSEWISKHEKTQAHIAETEKYAHVTYFFNGGRETKYINEEWFVVPSPKVSNFVLTPGMAMKEVVDKCSECIEKQYDFIVVNLAAPDLLGHTGDFSKTVEAISIMDDQVSRLYKKAVEKNYVLVLTADHGNSEQMILNGEVCKSHTTNKVLFMAINTHMKLVGHDDASLRDIAPTICKLMGIPIPEEMAGTSLLEY